jgi:hypothetical protein
MTNIPHTNTIDQHYVCTNNSTMCIYSIQCSCLAHQYYACTNQFCVTLIFNVNRLCPNIMCMPQALHPATPKFSVHNLRTNILHASLTLYRLEPKFSVPTPPHQYFSCITDSAPCNIKTQCTLVVYLLSLFFHISSMRPSRPS